MDVEAEVKVLSRATEEILPEGALLERLRLCRREGRPLRVKQGFDPTAPTSTSGMRWACASSGSSRISATRWC